MRDLYVNRLERKPMNILLKLLLGLVFSACLTGMAQAQAESDASSGIESMVQTLRNDMTDLQALSKPITESEKMEHEVLLFRRDVRSFRVLADFDLLVQELAKLPDDNPQKITIDAQLSEYAEGVGKAIFERISEINQRIRESLANLDTFSGGTRVAMQAYTDSMENIRIKYYQALVNHLKSRNLLGLPGDDLHKRLDPLLYLYAETLTGRIELNSATHQELQVRSTADPENADIKSALIGLNTRHSIDVNRLEAIILVLDSLGLDSADYKAVMLQQTGSLSVSFFSLKALGSVLRDAWFGLKETVKGNAPDLIFRLLLFIAMLFVFRILARITRRVVRSASERSSLDMSDLLKDMLVSTSGGIVMATGVLMALSQVGISLAPMLAGLGVAGFIVGFALQDSLGNFAAGAMILIYRPFDVNDFVEVTGASGLVKKMNLVSTTITTFDNQTLVVPNNKIWGDVIKNVTAQNQRRVDLEFGIGYDDDIEHAEKVLTEIVVAHEKVLKDPEPNIKLHTLGDSSVNFVVRPWVNTDDYWDVYWDIMREVKIRFDREGISIPFPQRDVHLYSEKED
jgi:small conductance mechanosensitive channel